MNFLQSCLFCVAILCAASVAPAQEWKSGVEWQEPPVVTPGATDNQPPSDAVVLFSGRDLSAFENGDQWLVQDGVAIPRKEEIISKQHFGDIQLHVEWAAPAEIKGEGQGRGNSGIFLMDRYEVQVLDSWENKTYFDGQAGAIYKQTPPMVNAMRKPGEWNTYDIFFTAPVFRGNGDVEKPGYITLVHNGVLVLNHFELLGRTSFVRSPRYETHADKGPISLQFHGDPVKFRNIWVRELHPPTGKRTSGPYVKIEGKKISPEAAAEIKEAKRISKAVQRALEAGKEKPENRNSDAGGSEPTDPKSEEEMP